MDVVYAWLVTRRRHDGTRSMRDRDANWYTAHVSAASVVVAATDIRLLSHTAYSEIIHCLCGNCIHCAMQDRLKSRSSFWFSISGLHFQRSSILLSRYKQLFILRCTNEWNHASVTWPEDPLHIQCSLRNTVVACGTGRVFFFKMKNQSK